MPLARAPRTPRGVGVALALACTIALVTGPRRGLAQAPPPPPPAPTLEPPALKTSSPVRYPAEAIRERHFEETAVVLLLELDAEGLVKSATAEGRPGHGFADEAEAAARRLVFAPARRNGVAVASRIRYRYVFSPPRPVLVGRVASAADDAPIADATVTVTLADGSTRSLSVDAAGRFRAAELPVGTVRVTVTAAGRVTATADDTLAFAEETSLTLRLRATPPDAGSPPATSGAEPAQEVAVRGERPPREVAKRTLSRQEIALIPGTNGDALRSVQSLPGVARPAPFSGQLFIRGSAAGDTPIYVDGTPVPIAYHFGGLSSVLPTESLDRIDFYPGNFGAAYGRGMGGVVNVALREPRSDRRHGMAQVDLVDARFVAEGPIASTGWTFSAGGRRSYVDAWLGPVLKNADANISTLPRYYDYQLMVQRRLGDTGSLRAGFFGSDDAFKFVDGQGGSAGLAISFWRAQAVATERLSDNTELRVVGAAGRDHVSVGFGSLAEITTSHPISLRAEVTHRLARGLRANVGLDVLYSPYELTRRLLEGSSALGPDQPEDPPGARTVAATASGRTVASAAYTELEISAWRGGRLVPSVRVDHTTATNGTDVAPRASFRQEIVGGVRRTTFKSAAGLYFQPPTQFQTDPTFGQRGLSSSRAVHLDVGLEHQLTPELAASVDVYSKQLDRLVVDGHGNAGKGRVVGADSFLRYQGDGRFFGWIAYSLSRSERRDGPTDPWVPFANDQTHVLTLVGSRSLGRGWRVGGRFRYVSGNPYTESARGAYDATSGGYLTARGPKNGARLPDFHQLDLRVDKTWRFAVTRLTAYLDVQNVYNHRAAESVLYGYDYTRSTYDSGLTIFPSLGLRVEY